MCDEVSTHLNLDIKMKFFSEITLIIILCEIGWAARVARLPKYLKRCKYHVSPSVIGSCIGNAMEDALRTMKNGEPALGIQSLDPLHVPILDILQGEGPVSLSIHHRNLTIFGVSMCKILDNQFDKNDGTMKGAMFCPKLILDGRYELTGRVLLLPVRGKGRSIITLDKNQCDFTAHGEQYQRDGALYTRYKKIDFTITPQKMVMNFENLFGEDKTLSKTINQFINENWREILKEMKPSYEAVFSKVFKDTVERVFNRIPVKNILTDFTDSDWQNNPAVKLE